MSNIRTEFVCIVADLFYSCDREAGTCPELLEFLDLKGHVSFIISFSKGCNKELLRNSCIEIC